MTLTDIPAFLLAVLAAWLGLSLLLRDSHDRVTRAFAWLSLHLTLYGLTTALAPLSTDSATARMLLQMQAIESVVLPPVFLHFIMRLVSGEFPPRQRCVLGLFYAIGVGMGLYALVGPGMLQEPTILRFPSGPLTWIWVLQRALPLIFALALMFLGYRRAGGDDLARRRRLMFGISAGVGAIGALIATASKTLVMRRRLLRKRSAIGMTRFGTLSRRPASAREFVAGGSPSSESAVGSTPSIVGAS